MEAGASSAGRSATVYAPRARMVPAEVGAAEAADEEAEDLGLPPGVLVPTIPPREHSERERLAMRPEIRGELGGLIDDLRTVFEADRATAMQAASIRCGICYLHRRLDELEYREAEGYYVCQRCSQALRGKRLPMIRRQQH